MNLESMVRIGKVSSVNAADRTARVAFEDRNNLVSGPLKIIKNPPFVTVKETTLTYGDQTENHAHDVTVSPWLPSPGEMVLCVFLPNGDGDGFVIGGI